MLVREIDAGARVYSLSGENYHPRISVVTPTFCRNGEGLLQRCLDSLAIQSLEDFEHIVIDDGSTDGTEKVVRNAATRDDRIVYVRHERNCGLPAVRTNEGILRARGEAVAFPFDDNVFSESFLEEAWAAMDESGADVVVANVEMRTEGGSFILGEWPLAIDLLMSLNTIPNGGVLVRRALFDRLGLYDPNLTMRRICDWDLWLRAAAIGVQFHHLDTVGAIEYGLVSPNSLGNTVGWDQKIAYTYMQNLDSVPDRNTSLRPGVIGDIDVLSPDHAITSIRSKGEWAQVAETFFLPFLSRGPVNLDATNRDNPLYRIPDIGWQGVRRSRVLVVSNAVSERVLRLMRRLRLENDLLVVQAPEWNLDAFSPSDFDVVLLVDSCWLGVIPKIEAFRSEGCRVVYAAQLDFADAVDEPDLKDVNSWYSNRGIVAFLEALGSKAPAFVTPPQSPSREQLVGARVVARLASYFLGTRRAFEALELECDFGEWSDGLAAAIGELPRSGPEFALAHPSPAARSTAEYADTYGTRLPPAPASAGAPIHGARAGRQDHEVQGTHSPPRRNDQVAHLIPTHGVSKSPQGECVSVLLHSRMYSGSEVFGLLTALAFQRIGYSVQVIVPSWNPYGGESGLSEINSWLRRNGLSEAIEAPYRPGAGALRRSPLERPAVGAESQSWLRELEGSTVFCSGFMPELAMSERRGFRLVMALFQPSAYDIRDIAWLDGRVDAFVTDCQWSLSALSRFIDAPGHLLYSPVPLDPSTVYEEVSSAGILPVDRPIRIAIGGTIQPRKRLLEAVQAVASLSELGIPAVLNSYGYALEANSWYRQLVEREISRLSVEEAVAFHGIVPLPEIAMNNDIVLSASIDESLPQTLVQLMAWGLVGVAALSGGIDEVIEDGVTGFMAADASSGALAEALMRAVGAAQEWPGIRMNALDLITRQHSLEAAEATLRRVLIPTACDRNRDGQSVNERLGQALAIRKS